MDRASAYAWLERYPEAVRDLEAALALDQTAGVLETDVVDDAYFSALLGAAKAEARTSMEAAERTLAPVQDRAARTAGTSRMPPCGPIGCAARPAGSRPW